jgi:hypothetical protein
MLIGFIFLFWNEKLPAVKNAFNIPHARSLKADANVPVQGKGNPALKRSFLAHAPLNRCYLYRFLIKASSPATPPFLKWTTIEPASLRI